MVEFPFKRQERLRSKVAVVVGGGSTGEKAGTGSAIARLFAAQGARVAVVGRTLLHTERTVAQISDGGGSSIAVLGDVRIAADCERIVSTVHDHFGRVDVLVNNVARIDRQSLLKVTADDWDRAMDTNLKAAFIMSQSTVPYMVEQGGGSIINIGSIAGLRASPYVSYGVSKAGLIGLTRSMALALGQQGIRVNCLLPGSIDTPMGAMSDEMRDTVRDLCMLDIDGDAWDVAWAAVFLASDESRFITAASLPIDGGVTEELLVEAHFRLRSRSGADVTRGER